MYQKSQFRSFQIQPSSTKPHTKRNTIHKTLRTHVSTHNLEDQRTHTKKDPPPWPLNPKPYKMQARPRPRIPSSKPLGGLQRPVGWWCHSRPGPPGSFFCWRKGFCACCGVAGLVGAVLFCFFGSLDWVIFLEFPAFVISVLGWVLWGATCCQRTWS